MAKLEEYSDDARIKALGYDIENVFSKKTDENDIIEGVYTEDTSEKKL